MRYHHKVGRGNTRMSMHFTYRKVKIPSRLQEVRLQAQGFMKSRLLLRREPHLVFGEIVVVDSETPKELLKLPKFCRAWPAGRARAPNDTHGVVDRGPTTYRLNPASPTSLAFGVQLNFRPWKLECADYTPLNYKKFQSIYTLSTTFPSHQTHHKTQAIKADATMSSFLGFGRPQPTSAEKIAAVEAEMKLIIDMQNRYAPLLASSFLACAPSIPTAQECG